MLLAIDIGNISTVIGVFDGKRLINCWRTETRNKSTGDEFALVLRDFFGMAGHRFEQVNGVAISNVVPSVEHAICSMSRRYFNIEPVSVNAGNIGIKINYPNPSEIGADRLVNAVAAYELYRAAAIIIDFGTATTFDYVNEKGEYCGGVIAPGISIANEALYRWTSKLPRVDIGRTSSVICKSTVEAIRAGVYHGYVGLVKHLIAKMKVEINAPARIVATGGLASLIVKDLEIEIEKNLTLDGLKIVYERLLNNFAITG